MPKICYIKRNFTDQTLPIIEAANDILRNYERLGYDMTLRQLYYQMIAKDLFPYPFRNYRNFSAAFLPSKSLLAEIIILL